MILSFSQSIRVTNGVTMKELKVWKTQNWTFKQILFDNFIYNPENKVENNVFIGLYQTF